MEYENKTSYNSSFSINETSTWNVKAENDTNIENGTLEITIIFENDKYLFHGFPLVITMSLLIIIFMILAIGGNIMVILTIVRHRGMRTRTNMFIVNLAVADILVAFLDMPFSLATMLEGDWIFGESMCQFNGFTMALFLICSIHTLMYIAIHKFISITKPFSRAMTPKRIKMMIAATWIWSFICALTPLIGWSSIVYKKGASQCGPSIPKGLLALSHSLFITTTNYIIPLGVMLFCYWRIFKEIHNHMVRIRETSNINMESSIQQQKKVSVTLLLVLACFLICWTPFVAYSTTVALIKVKEKVSPFINPLAYWFGYMNSACNPIIYAFRSPSFRQGYKEIMCGKAVPGLSGVHSLSFKSRSGGRGSLKSNQLHSQVSTTSQKKNQDVSVNHRNNRPRTTKRMLSQTSWRSLPIIPYIIRSFSSSAGSSVKVRSTKVNENQRHPRHVAEWGHCICCSSDISDDDDVVGDTCDKNQSENDNVTPLHAAELNTVNFECRHSNSENNESDQYIEDNEERINSTECALRDELNVNESLKVESF